MSQPPYQPPYQSPQQPYPYNQSYGYGQPQPSNGLGVAGFIVSLVGLVLGGVLSPIGLVLSFIAVFRRPRGFAIAGIVIGLIGSLEVLLILTVFGFVGMTCIGVGKAVQPILNTQTVMVQAEKKIQDYSASHMGIPPSETDGNALISGYSDGWGQHLKYELTGPTAWDVRSAGPDGKFGTSDDIVEH